MLQHIDGIGDLEQWVDDHMGETPSHYRTELVHRVALCVNNAANAVGFAYGETWNEVLDQIDLAHIMTEVDQELAPTLPFILVFRPHQMPAFARAYQNQDEFLDAWRAGNFARSCNTAGPDDREVCDYEAAIEDVGHDLHCVTRLDSQAEFRRYIREANYCGTHNKGLGVTHRAAEDLGWTAQ